MCLLVVAFGLSARQPLIVAGNRDEFHRRPALPADWWTEPPDILGGRDLQAGGTWLALHRNGRFATVTNFRDAQPAEPGMQSRGRLVTDFLQSELAPLAFLESIDGNAFAGFNLLVHGDGELGYLSNRGAGPRLLAPGIYGVSNATLDTPWDKLVRTRQRLQQLLVDDDASDAALFELLGDRRPGPVEEVQPGHLDFATAHAISAPFIVLPDYGTRCSTVVRADRDGGWAFSERRFDPAGRQTGESRFSVARQDAE